MYACLVEAQANSPIPPPFPPGRERSLWVRIALFMLPVLAPYAPNGYRSNRISASAAGSLRGAGTLPRKGGTRPRCPSDRLRGLSGIPAANCTRPPPCGVGRRGGRAAVAALRARAATFAAAHALRAAAPLWGRRPGRVAAPAAPAAPGWQHLPPGPPALSGAARRRAFSRTLSGLRWRAPFVSVVVGPCSARQRLRRGAWRPLRGRGAPLVRGCVSAAPLPPPSPPGRVRSLWVRFCLLS